MSEKISTKLKVELAPWTAPGFALRVTEAEGTEGIPVRDLDDDALEDLALAWVRELYKNAGRTHAPFYKSAKKAPRND